MIEVKIEKYTRWLIQPSVHTHTLIRPQSPETWLREQCYRSVGWQARMDEQAGLQEHQRTAPVPPNRHTQTSTPGSLARGLPHWCCSRGSEWNLKSEAVRGGGVGPRLMHTKPGWRAKRARALEPPLPAFYCPSPTRTLEHLCPCLLERGASGCLQMTAYWAPGSWRGEWGGGVIG